MSSLLPSRLENARLIGIGPPVPRGRTGPGLQLSLGRAGACPEKPQLYLGIFDDSISMRGGNDSTGYRYAETAIALEQIGRRCRCGRELMALQHMSSPTSADRAPTPLKGRGWRDLVSGLRIPADGDGASILRPNLQRSLQLVDDYPDHVPTLVVFSDFELFDEDLPGLWRDLTSFPGVVHAVVLRAQPPQVLLNDPRITVTSVPYGLPPGAVATTVFGILAATRPRSSANPQLPR